MSVGGFGLGAVLLAYRLAGPSLLDRPDHDTHCGHPGDDLGSGKPLTTGSGWFAVVVRAGLLALSLVRVMAFGAGGFTAWLTLHTFAPASTGMSRSFAFWWAAFVGLFLFGFGRWS